MRFRIKEDVIHLYLSPREVERYNVNDELAEINTVKDSDLPFRVTDSGQYQIQINERTLDVNINVEFLSEVGYRITVSTGDYEFNFDSVNEINKYNLFRELIRHYRHIVGE